MAMMCSETKSKTPVIIDQSFEYLNILLPSDTRIYDFDEFVVYEFS